MTQNGHLDARLANIEKAQASMLIILSDLREKQARVETKLYLMTAMIAFVVATGRDLLIRLVG